MSFHYVLPELGEFISQQPIISSHCHHLPDDKTAAADLRFILDNSYCSWMEETPQWNGDAVEGYVNRMKTNTYFRWLQQSLKALYGMELSKDTYRELDARIKSAYADPAYHLHLLKDKCNYAFNVLDSYWLPGSNNGHPEIFKHTFRCDMYYNAYDYDKLTKHGVSVYNDEMRKEDTRDFAAFVENTKGNIRKHRQNGASAIKIGIAYHRSLDFQDVSFERGAQAFLNPDATPRQIKDFGDYITYVIVRQAGELGMPVLIHTGLGLLDNSNAIHLRPLIEKNPDVRFVLFHGGFPWSDDVLGLLHNYKNVVADFCWLPIICTNKAKEFIVNALETGGAHRLCWGCDTWTSEESYGTRLALEHALGGALTQMILGGAFDMDYAKYAVTRILYENPKEIFGIT
ncbi:MAG: amidohydrolase family protein [Christensenellales bacterium]|jgi:predicted TIM-barrel fold metal-dependent hydrolase